MLLKYAMGLGKTAIAFLLLAAKEQCTVDHNGKHVFSIQATRASCCPTCCSSGTIDAHQRQDVGQVRGTVNPNEIRGLRRRRRWRP